MIDTDKMRAAYAATPLCQKDWTKKDGNNPTMLCAVSALVAFAGVQPDLIHKMNEVLDVDRWVDDFAAPVLEAEYGIPESISEKMPRLFDTQENEWRGVQAVLDLCEQHNMSEMHFAAIREDAERFPQYGPEEQGAWLTIGAIDYGYSSVNFSGNFVLSNFAVAPVAAKKVKQPPVKLKPGQSAFWTAKKASWLTKPLALSK